MTHSAEFAWFPAPFKEPPHPPYTEEASVRLFCSYVALCGALKTPVNIISSLLFKHITPEPPPGIGNTLT